MDWLLHFRTSWDFSGLIVDTRERGAPSSGAPWSPRGAGLIDLSFFDCVRRFYESPKRRWAARLMIG